MVHIDVKATKWWKESPRSAKGFAGTVHNLIWGKNRNAMLLFVGDPGSGKSYAAISIACMIDPNFSIEKVVFTPEDFLNALDKAKRGDVIIWDEAGVGMPARDWNTIQNKVLAYVIQTFRFQNIGVFFTTPGSTLLDKVARILINFQVKVIDYNRETRHTTAVVYEREYDPVRDILNWVKWQKRENGKVVDPNPIFIPHPPDDIAREYEKISREYKVKVREEAKEKIEAYRQGLSMSATIDGRHLRKLENQAQALRNLVKSLLDQGYRYSDIARLMGINQQTMYAWKNEWGL